MVASQGTMIELTLQEPFLVHRQFSDLGSHQAFVLHFLALMVLISYHSLNFLLSLYIKLYIKFPKEVTVL